MSANDDNPRDRIDRADAWQRFQARAGFALTRLHRLQRPGDTPRQVLLEGHANPWALLACELRDDGEAISVHLEAPGMTPEAFDLRVVDDYLVIQGERRMAAEEQAGHYHIMERAYGVFERVIPLPEPVDDRQARARYRDGVLSVTLPKRRRQRRVAVNATGAPG